MASSPPLVILDRYRLAEWLGQGNMGVVYRARDEKLDRPVVIKFLLQEGEAVSTAAGGSRSARFLREARSVARLSHPNIMSIYDVGQQGEWDFLILEYIPGKDLQAVLRQHGGRVPEGEVTGVARAVLQALAYAHEQGIIHRDLKPENIKITPAGQVKVMDFSLALARGEERLTQEGAVVGTALYLAPESLLGRGSDARSDLYSLGSVLYELLTGRPPYTGDSLITLISNILHGTFEPVRSLAVDVSPGLERVVLRLLSRDPAQRYSSAQEALDNLNKAGEPEGQTDVSSKAPVNPASAFAAATAAVEEERRRMAGMVQTRVIEPLDLLLSQVGAFDQTLASAPAARTALSVVSALARQVLQQARDLEDALHPAVLETLGLEPALEMLRDPLARTSGLRLALEIDRFASRPPASLELTVFRLAQETLEALPALFVTQATLRLGCQEEEIRLSIEWPSGGALPQKQSEDFRRRVAALGGRVEAVGGRVILSLPLRGAAELTARELDVLQGLVEGLSNKEIAARLSISPRTVNFHLDNIFAKLGVSSRTEAAVIAQRQGWARRPSDILPR
jgi:eukaryotic-like serine/threonine-protein kinase